MFRGDQVDVEASDRRMRDAGLGLYRSQSTSPAAVDHFRYAVDPTQQPVDRGSAPVDADEIGPSSVDDFLAALNRGEYHSQVDAQKIKENILAARHLMSLRKEAGELIEVERASLQFFQLARQARDAWMTWPTRIGPMLAADLGVETPALVEALNRYVQEQLERIGEKEPNFDEEQ